MSIISLGGFGRGEAVAGVGWWSLVVAECVERTDVFPVTVLLLMVELESEEDSMILSETSREGLGVLRLLCCRSCVKKTSGSYVDSGKEKMHCFA